MKTVYLSIISLAITSICFAQNFNYPIGQHVVDTIDQENYEAYEIKIETDSPEAIHYGWKRISNSFSNNWSYSLCDYGECHVGIPTTSDMDAISLSQAENGTHGFFKLNITVGSFYGEGTVEIYVYDMNDFSRGDTVSWKLVWILAGDVNGNGVIDLGEISGDLNEDGIINNGEIAGDSNGNGAITDGEIAGDINGDFTIGIGEATGDLNGNGIIGSGEVAYDQNGNGVLEASEAAAGIDKHVLTTINVYPNPASDVI